MAPTLFLIHPIGGMVGSYMPIAQKLEKILHVVGLIAQGLTDEDPEPIDHFDTLVLKYAQDIKRTQKPNRPFSLGGWSMGGLIALEVAKLLKHEQYLIDHVILIDTWPPAPSENPRVDEDSWIMIKYCQNLFGTLDLQEEIDEHLIEDPIRFGFD